VAQALQAAEKLKFLSFRGTLRAEESLILLKLKPGEIPRFARNDKIIYFFRSLFSLWMFALARTKFHRLNRLRKNPNFCHSVARCVPRNLSFC